MISTTILKEVSQNLRIIARRNVGICAPALQKATDPIQQLFIQKVREYKEKSSGGKILDSSPETKKQLDQELEKVSRQYGMDKVSDPTKFPQFNFKEPKLEI